MTDGYTTDRNDPQLREADARDPHQQAAYLVLSDEERAKGFVRKVRMSYRHTVCHSTTTMGLPLAETYARDPGFYDGTYCVHCREHFPVREFVWTDDGSVVGS